MCGSLQRHQFWCLNALKSFSPSALGCISPSVPCGSRSAKLPPQQQGTEQTIWSKVTKQVQITLTFFFLLCLYLVVKINPPKCLGTFQFLLQQFSSFPYSCPTAQPVFSCWTKLTNHLIFWQIQELEPIFGQDHIARHNIVTELPHKSMEMFFHSTFQAFFQFIQEISFSIFLHLEDFSIMMATLLQTCGLAEL